MIQLVYNPIFFLTAEPFDNTLPPLQSWAARNAEVPSMSISGVPAPPPPSETQPPPPPPLNPWGNPAQSGALNSDPVQSPVATDPGSPPQPTVTKDTEEEQQRVLPQKKPAVVNDIPVFDLNANFGCDSGMCFYTMSSLQSSISPMTYRKVRLSCNLIICLA